MSLVESVPIEGLSVYGVQQKNYTANGVVGCDYVKAASIAMFQEANAIESETSAYAAVLEARQKKLFDKVNQMSINLIATLGVIGNRCQITVRIPAPMP